LFNPLAYITIHEEEGGLHSLACGEGRELFTAISLESTFSRREAAGGCSLMLICADVVGMRFY